MNKKQLKAFWALPLIVLLFCCGPVWAVETEQDGFSLRSEQLVKRLDIYSGLEMGALAAQGAQLMGFGVNAGVRYAIRDKWAIDFTLAQALSFGGGISAVYTSLSGVAFYSVLGDFVSREERVYLGNELVSLTKIPRSQSLGVGLGIEQYLLNSVDQVVPASGLLIKGAYVYPFENWGLMAFVRGGYLLIGPYKVVSFGSGIGAIFQF